MSIPENTLNLGLDSHKLHYHPLYLSLYLQNQTLRNQLYPIYVEFSPVGHCNNRCSFCALDYLGYKKTIMDTKTSLRLFSDLSAHGTRSILFAGEGEPMLHPELGFLAKSAKEQGLDVALGTNGSLYTKEFAKKYTKDFTWVKFSVNGGTPDSYAKVHGCRKGLFREVFDNIKYAVQHKGDTTIGVQCVVLKDNVETIENLVQLCKLLGVDYVVLKPYSRHESSLHETVDVRYEEYWDMLQKVELYSTNYGTRKFSVVVRKNTMKYWDSQYRAYDKCYAVPYLWCYVASTGAVCVCSCFLGQEEWNIGNINVQSFEEIWYGKRRKEVIARMADWDIQKCRINCRMDKCNRYLDNLIHPPKHKNFI